MCAADACSPLPLIALPFQPDQQLGFGKGSKPGKFLLWLCSSLDEFLICPFLFLIDRLCNQKAMVI